MNKWQLFPVVGPDLNNDHKPRWYWRHATPDYVATSMAGFDTLEACIANAREHGMTDGKWGVLDRAPRDYTTSA